MCTIAIYQPITINLNAPEALKIAVTVADLKNRGVDVDLYNFENDATPYLDDALIEAILMQDGPDAFPVTVVDGEVFLKKEYPHYNELMAWSSGVPTELFETQA